jgi:hypothetical protein
MRLGMVGLLVLLASLPACPPTREGCSSCQKVEPKDASADVDIAKQGGDGVTKPTLKPPSVVVTGHPRLFIREGDIARLRTFASPGNSIYESGLKKLVDESVKAMDNGTMKKEDTGAINGWSYPNEAYAMLFAFMSLVSPSQADRDAFGKRAKTLLMDMIKEAAKGAAPDKPFRDARFSIGDRSRWNGEAFPLTVDWIYPLLSADDKKLIRTVFLRWAGEIQRAETTTMNHPEPLGVVNDPQLLTDPKRVRWAGNNYYTAHMRNLGMMAMALDPADDEGGKLANHLASVTGAWLYVSDALMRGDMRGGLAAEGFEYSPQAVGYVAQLLLALHTAGRADPASYGKQATFANPYWDDVIPGFLHSLAPVARTPKDENFAYMGPLHPVAWYGDGQKYWAPDHMGLFGAMGLYAQYTSDEKRLAQLRWIEMNFAPGGPAKRDTRAGDNNAVLDCIFYFLLFDPKANAPPDPRPTYPLSHFSPGLGRILARTSWTANASWFSYKLGWTTLDHQHADGNMFELYRKGEWLTKERTGYGDDIACTDQKNSITIQNDEPSRNHGYLKSEWKRGSQWTYATDGDGKILASRIGPDFVYALGDATQLYNSKYEHATDVLHASRSIVWIVPDRVITYDRAAGKTANRAKRYWLQLPNKGTVANGLMTMTTDNGQSLFVKTLLPDPATGVVEAVEALNDDNGRQPATLDPIRFRYKVEAPGNPKTVRWLHVLQGADGNVTADNATLVTSSGGTAFQGASFNDTVVMFPVDIPVSFTSLTYSAPASTKAHLVTGLTPNAGYKVTTQPSGGTVNITVASGGDQKADAGGVLVIGKLP